jgi:RNA polymerase sigma-70 factor (ECF subfamily)
MRVVGCVGRGHSNNIATLSDSIAAQEGVSMLLSPNETFLTVCEAPMESEESRLVRRAKDGDEAAFVELHRRHARLAASVIFRIMKNPEDTEDVLQETFVRALTHLHRFDGRSKFSTWLTRIAINTSLMQLRRRKSRPEYVLDRNYDGEAEIMPDLADPGLDPEKSFLHNSALSEVRGAMQRLPLVLRETIALRCSEGMPVREIASTMGVSVAAAKSRLLRANQAVREILEADARAHLYRSSYTRTLTGARGRQI